MLVLAALLTAATGCGDGTGPGGGAVVVCDEVVPTTLSPGQVALVDASDTACIRIPAAGAGGADYLYVAYSAAGEESVDGTSAEYQLTGTGGTPPPAAVVRPGAQAARFQPTAAQRFHSRLRALGQDLARSRPGARLRARAAPSVRAVSPSLGAPRTFNVLRSSDVSGTQPGDYVQVASTARYVGTHVTIYLDDAAPVEGGYTQGDLDAIGSLFDDHLHPIDVNAFGSETDVNGDGMVLVLLTDRVTRLAGCGLGQIVVGLFFAVDLIADHVGSNNAEIFYGLAPNVECQVDRVEAVRALPGVFIHEFQHMINYGQHVLQRDGDAEDTWLDEGLAGMAEELGGRLVPDDRCLDSDCLTQFHSGNFSNAYRYLAQVSTAYLIGPRQPPLPLTEYGATWLFVRWLSDHFAAEPTLGTDVTRALVQTTRTGAENVVSATETPFDRLLGEWQLANYLEDHPDFEALTAGTRFRYTSWNIRGIYASFHQQDPAQFPSAYPLEPDVFTGDDYVRTGVLPAGSGQHLLVEHAASAPALDLLLTGLDAANALSPDVSPRTILLRLR
ncbi:MAG TPA: hypothetical protein VM094_01390 [Gemmatimonadales bacterium]|nr:hypothetical protein [Gemmatimonadales bacterium]